MPKISRRKLLIQSARLSAIATIVPMLTSCKKKSGLLCADPAILSESEMGLRNTLAYVEVSPNSHQTCTICAFFTPSEKGGCGFCEIFKDRPVSPTGHCSAWSNKKT